MDRKFLKAFAIIFTCFLLSVGFVARAQSGQLTITSVNESVFLGTSVHVKGVASPNDKIALSINDEKDIFAYSIKTNSDANGNWSADFDQSLKSGKYYIEAIEEDVNGVQVGQAKYGPIEVRGSFAFIVEVFSVLVIILLAGFVGGWYINKLAEIKRLRRILISQRDIVASYNILKKDVDKASKNLEGDSVDGAKISETQFLLKRIGDNLDKMNNYVVKGINIISKYDIISKIDNILKLKSKKTT